MALMFDVDNDGWTDILQPFDRGYWRNNQSGGFSWVANIADNSPHLVSAQFVNAVNHTIAADFNADGLMDYIVGRVPYLYSPTPETVFLTYRNNGNGTFTLMSDNGLDNGEFELPNSSQSWAQYSNSTVADINLDGLPDIIYGGKSFGSAYQYAINNGGFNFLVVDQNWGGPHGSGGYVGVAWASAADLDNDGKIDALINARTDADHNNIATMMNTSTNVGNWLKIYPRGAAPNTDGLHTKITLTEANSSNIVSSVQSGRYGRGQGSYMVPHLGLGDNGSVDVTVRWPNGGATYSYDNIPANQSIVVYPDGCLVQAWTPGSGVALTSSGQSCTNPQ